MTVWGQNSWPLFGVESQPLLGVQESITGIGMKFLFAMQILQEGNYFSNTL